MSILHSHSIAGAVANIRGEDSEGNQVDGFSLDGLSIQRLAGIEAAPGHEEFDCDRAWEMVVRSWWGMGATWGIGVATGSGRCDWNLVLPSDHPRLGESLGSHLTGAQVGPLEDLHPFLMRFQALPHRVAMAGHPGLSSRSRLDLVIGSLLDCDVSIIVLADAVSRSCIDKEMACLIEEEQFVRDEFLSRPGLERENHPEATQYLSLLEGAQDRAKSAIQEGGWQTRFLLAGAEASRVRQAQGLIQGAFSDGGGMPEPLRWQDPRAPRKLTFLRTAEMAALTRPPTREMPGFSIEAQFRQDGDPAVHVSRSVFSNSTPENVDEPTIAIGRIVDDRAKAGPWLDLSTKDLCRHLLVGGMTGSGKSVTCEHLLLELWREHEVPWLVVEPGMKASYRRLLHSEIGEDLSVWGIGDSSSRRLPMNPLSAPAGVGVAEHSSALFSAISSAFELVPPMPEVLATAIERTFQKHGWELSGKVPPGSPPRLEDLVEEIDSTISTLGYGREITGNLRAGLLLRLRRLLDGPLSPELAAESGLDVEELISRPSILELSSLPDAESQALMMALIALQLRHYWRLEGQSDQLRHVLLLEEAHRLLRELPRTTENSARSRAVEDMAHLLAELRGFGAGLVVVDQTPAALTSSVIANTGTKILHRLDHPDDREIAGRASGLPSEHLDLLGGLRVGEAVFRSDRRPRPYRLRMPNPSLTYGGLPLPSLPGPATRVSTPSAAPNRCPICMERACLASKTGAESRVLVSRLKGWQEASRGGGEASWQWAKTELEKTGVKSVGIPAPLCFLVSLGRAGGLRKSTIDQIVRAYQKSNLIE